MGTRGLYGYKIDGELKLTYNHGDSYPSYLGSNVIKYICLYSIDEIKQIAKSIEMVNDPDDYYYNNLRKHQGDLRAYHRNGVTMMIDNRDFIEDALFCEWAYIINLDTLKLEIYRNGDYLIKEIPLKRIRERGNLYRTMMDNGLEKYYSKKKAEKQWRDQVNDRNI